MPQREQTAKMSSFIRYIKMITSEMLIKYEWVGYSKKVSLNTTTIRKIRSMKTLILKPKKNNLHNLIENTKNRNTT